MSVHGYRCRCRCRDSVEHVLGEKKPEGGFVPLDGLLASTSKPAEVEVREEVGAMGD